MARQKDLLSRLADAGEEAIQRLADVPGADRVTGALGAMRDRMDEMQKRLRGLEALDRRLAELERRVDKLEGKTAPARSGARSPAKAATTTKTSPGTRKAATARTRSTKKT
jgi:TolA-binding protein